MDSTIIVREARRTTSQPERIGGFFLTGRQKVPRHKKKSPEGIQKGTHTESYSANLMDGKATCTPPAAVAPPAFTDYWTPMNGNVAAFCRPPAASCTSGIYRLLGIGILPLINKIIQRMNRILLQLIK